MVLPVGFPIYHKYKNLNIYAMNVQDIHQKDNVVDYRSTDGGDGRLRGGIQRYRLVELAYSPISVGREAPFLVAKRPGIYQWCYDHVEDPLLLESNVIRMTLPQVHRQGTLWKVSCVNQRQELDRRKPASLVFACASSGVRNASQPCGSVCRGHAFDLWDQHIRTDGGLAGSVDLR